MLLPRYNLEVFLQHLQIFNDGGLPLVTQKCVALVLIKADKLIILLLFLQLFLPSRLASVQTNTGAPFFCCFCSFFYPHDLLPCKQTPALESSRCVGWGRPRENSKVQTPGGCCNPGVCPIKRP